MTLNSRRSGTGTALGVCGMGGVTPRTTPQSLQNRLSAGFSLPHELHSHGRAVPQSPQNLLPAATSAPQRGHIIQSTSYVSTAGEPLYSLTFQRIQFSGSPGGVKILAEALEIVCELDHMAHKLKTVARQRRPQIQGKNQKDIRLNKQNIHCAQIEGGALPPNVKTTSVLRRVPLPRALYYVKVHGLEGHVCAFQVAPTSSTILVEAISGRLQTLLPGDFFLATPGHRESNIVLVGGIPQGGLVPGKAYWVISYSGVVGELITGTPLAKRFLGQVTYLGTVIGDGGGALALRQFAVPAVPRFKDYGATLSLIVGTGPEVGKTTAGLGVLRTLLAKGHAKVIVLKATGTSSVAEIANYQDYGAAQVFDCVDFGLPTTYPSKRKGMERIFDRALDTCLAMPANAVIIECGGDMLAANIPVFLRCLKRRRSNTKVVLAAADPLGAWGATRMLRDIGLPVNLITGPCTDTPASQHRTQSLCKVAAMNMARRES